MKNLITEEKQNTLQEPEQEQKEPKSFYTWSCVTYMNEDTLKKLLKEQTRNYAYILHDSDIDKQGKHKENHFHFVATFEQRKSFRQIMRIIKLYESDQNTLVQPCMDIANSLEYLWHANDQTKYQYDKRKVVISKKEWFDRYIRGNDESENDKFVDDLLAPTGQFSIVRMARKYGRDFIRNTRSYMEFRRLALQEEAGASIQDLFFCDKNAEALNDLNKE